ncbi:butyrate kinase [Candidatus Fermentibacteria bacterium]|nr:butyrate kinase [Candidatus Fermentibacteria bacterium]
MSEDRLILAVNPGGTSTKLGVYRETEEVFAEVVRHTAEELEAFDFTLDQLDFRRQVVERELKSRNYSVDRMAAVVGRGGTFKSLQSGTYRVNEKLLADIRDGSTLQADHPSNLGAPLAYALAEPHGKPSFFVDPVSVDEMIDEARLSGHPLLPRISLSHALNIRMVAYKATEDLGKNLDDTNMVVLHLGSGISVNAICKGRMIDTNNANDGGPFSPQRVGSLPTTGLMKLCCGGEYDPGQLKKMFLKEGGLKAYTGTDHVGEARERARKGDREADLALRAMAYQIIKEAGAMAAALDGEVDCLVITGGVAHDEWMVERISKGVEFMGRVLVFPGECELEALVRGVLRVFDSVEQEKVYS